jgi:hypothetical protein
MRFCNNLQGVAFQLSWLDLAYTARIVNCHDLPHGKSWRLKVLRLFPAEF